MCANPQETADLITFTEETLNGIFFSKALITVRDWWQIVNQYKSMQM